MKTIVVKCKYMFKVRLKENVLCISMKSWLVGMALSAYISDPCCNHNSGYHELRSGLIHTESYVASLFHPRVYVK